LSEPIERQALSEPIGRLVCFVPVYLALLGLVVERLAYSWQVAPLGEAVAFPTRAALVAAGLEALCSRYSLQAVVHYNPQEAVHHDLQRIVRQNLQVVVLMDVCRASERSAPGEPVQSGEVRDEAARFVSCERVQDCGAVSGLREVVQWELLSASKR
jgi:hypothetical protein